MLVEHCTRYGGRARLLLLLLVPALSHGALAAEPPPCRPVTVAQPRALQNAIGWPGLQPVRGWKRTRVELDRCQTSAGAARLTVEVAARAPGSRWPVLYATELVIPVDPEDGHVLAAAPERAAVKGAVRSLMKAARTAERHPFVGAWIRHHLSRGTFEPVLLDDEGGYGPVCLSWQLAPSAKGAPSASLSWCLGEAGLGAWTVLSPAGFKAAPVPELLKLAAGSSPDCEVLAVSVSRPGRAAQASIRVRRTERCAHDELRAVSAAGGAWTMQASRQAAP